jgi:hypothetical protein
MKLALPVSLKLPVLSCMLLLPVLSGATACGAEAPLPETNGAGTSNVGGASVVPSGGSAGMVSASGSGTSTTGGTDVSTTGGTGVTPIAGSGGVATTGGVSSGGGGAGGAAGGTPPSGGGGSGGAPILLDVAAQLDGAMLLGKCLSDSAVSVCQTSQNGCPPANQADPALSGVITTDKMVTLGGDPAKAYTITLHVQGEVESKRYTGGQDQNSQLTSPKADGFVVGGVPSNENAYNVYMARVSSPKKDFFFNSLQGPGVSNHTTYGIDYVAKIQANGGATIRLVAADSNCSMIKNCGPMENSGNQCTAPIILQNMDAKAVSKNPTFDFTKAYNGQWVVMVVTDVTTN